MIETIQTLWPEITLFVTACLVIVAGLSPERSVRRLTAAISIAGLVVAGALALYLPEPARGVMPGLAVYGKAIAAAMGVLLVLLVAGLPDRELEESLDRAGPKARFEPLRSNRAEFYGFLLFSLTGLMLCAGADDLIWLFLALELTSLPTYVMVAISTPRSRSMEAGVKYFFLGAMGAALFLYGFALIYGGTGTTHLHQIRSALAAGGGGPNLLLQLGLLLAALGIGVKIAAVPMHFYTPDVYQGAAAPISAFLAFVPKAAGFFALILLACTVGWRYGPDGGGSLPNMLYAALWIMAVLTMTVGNVLAIMQNSVKRILAYSSIAHSGYMLVGVIAGPGRPGPEGDTSAFATNGLAAVLFYLFSYGVMNLGAFAVLASLERRAEGGVTDEIDSVGDLRGLCATSPVLGWTMVLSSVGLLGLPLTLGFVAKLPLFTSGIAAGEIPLVVILGVNSAIAAFYYLRLAAAPLLEAPEESLAGPARRAPFPARIAAGLVSAAAVIVLGLVSSPLSRAAEKAAQAPRAAAAPRPTPEPGSATADSRP